MLMIFHLPGHLTKLISHLPLNKRKGNKPSRAIFGH